MDVASLVQALLSPALHSVLAHYAPFVPYVVAACVVYLLVNDGLDVALLAKRGKLSGVSSVVQALANDVLDRRAGALALTAALTALAAGGDFRAAFVSALVGVAAGNFGNFEDSTLSKVRELLS